MVDRINKKWGAERDKITLQGSAANYFSDNLTATHSISKDNPRVDDVIVSLANAHENRRARQVTEWEQMRQVYFRPMA